MSPTLYDSYEVRRMPSGIRTVSRKDARLILGITPAELADLICQQRVLSRGCGNGRVQLDTVLAVLGENDA